MSESTVTTANGSPLSVEQFGYTQELKRALGLKDLIIFGMIFAVPLAPFTIFAYVLETSKGMIALTYLITTFCMLLTANSYGWLASEFPLAGSAYNYASRGVSQGFGLVCGWALILDYIIIPSTLYVWSAYALKSVMPGVPSWIWIAGFIVINTYINIIGIELTAKINKIFLYVQLFVLAWFFFAVIQAVSSGVEGTQFTTYAFLRPEDLTHTVIFAAVAMAVYNFIGVDALTTLAEETKGGYKTVGIGMGLSTVCIGSIFIVLTYLGTLMFPEWANVGDPATALYIAAQRAGGPSLHWVVVVVSAVSIGFACSMCCQASVARVLFGMSRDKMLPKVFSKVSDKYQTPWVGILVTAGFSMVMGFGFANHGEILFQFACFGALLTFCLVNMSAFIYFGIKKKSKKIFFHYIAPLTGALIVGYSWINLNTNALLVGFGWLGLGVIYFCYLKYVKKVGVTLGSIE